MKLLVVATALTATLGLLAFTPDRGHGHEFRAELRGDNEIPPVDTDTSGKLRVHFAQDYSSATVRLEISKGERITQAHFHCGDAGLNGPVVVFLAGFHDRGWDLDGRWIDNLTITDENIVNMACGSTLRELADAMRDGRVYVNAHSVAVPSGVVRGQVEEH